uniref:Translation initiation factor 5A C-terminal domain-containing protein n=1 Tax=Chinchilla lanigera TaxID=34839 RepID=A0A8C2VAT5_CHILA
MADKTDFTTGDAGASSIYPMQCLALHKNIEMSTSKAGKHGKKYEGICPSTHNMDVPNFKRNDYQLICIPDGYLTWLTETGEILKDLTLPEGELGKEIEGNYNTGEDVQVSVMCARSEECAVAIKSCK